MPLLLGVDIGTYSSKGVLVDEHGAVLASHSLAHALDLPHPGWAEHDPERVWWADFVAICQALLATSRVEPGRIAGLAISTISPAVVLVDAAGRALRPAILYGIDTRATAECTELQALTGAVLTSQHAAPKLMWIRRNEPDVWARTAGVLNGPGYLAFKLTGEATIDYYNASIFTPFFNLNTNQWDASLAEVVAPLDWMPRLTWTCELAGRVTPWAARQTGLAAGTPLITGTDDASAEAISAGLSEVGDLAVTYGSSTFFLLKTGRLFTPPAFWGSPFLEPGTFIVAGGTATAGSLTKWFRDQLAQPELAAEQSGGENAYAALARLAETSPPGANGLVVLPYFAGERTPLNDPHARGVFFGLTLSHTRADLYRAVLEATGYAIRHNLDALIEEGMQARRILAVGGGTLNRPWMQMVSDIAGITQHIPTQQLGACYGDALLAGVGAGLFSSPAQAAGWVSPGQVIEPDPATRDVYEQRYRVYRELYAATAGLMRRI